MMPEPLVVVTATAPTPNGPLHVGHLSGPFIAADIAARAARAQGTRTLTVSGVDPHQNYVRTKATTQARKVTEVLDEYEALVRQALGAARISYDVFNDPRADEEYRTGVRGLLDEFRARGAAVTERYALSRCRDCGATLHHAYVAGRCPRCGQGSSGGTCEPCGAFTTAANLDEVSCARCGGAAEAFTAEIPLLRLEDYRTVLSEYWSVGTLPVRVRSLIGYYLAHGLPDVPLAYPTDWGIEADDRGQRIDVWVEMGIGLLAATARRLNPGASGLDDYIRAWQQVSKYWHFLGIDNAFYFAVLFPALFAAAGLGPGRFGGLVVNEFYRLDGLKFSTSRGHAVWAHEFLAAEDPAIVRLFLCWDRPDRFESDFTQAAYAEFRDWIGPRLHAGGTRLQAGGARLQAGGARLQAGGALPAELAGAEVRRAWSSLEFTSFDPGMALRCLLAVNPDQAAPVLRVLAGEDDPT